MLNSETPNNPIKLYLPQLDDKSKVAEILAYAQEFRPRFKPNAATVYKAYQWPRRSVGETYGVQAQIRKIEPRSMSDLARFCAVDLTLAQLPNASHYAVSLDHAGNEMCLGVGTLEECVKSCTRDVYSMSRARMKEINPDCTTKQIHDLMAIYGTQVLTEKRS